MLGEQKLDSGVWALFNVHKLPFPVALLLAIVSGMLTIAPPGWRDSLKIPETVPYVGPFIGIGFLLSSGLVAIAIGRWAIGAGQLYVREQRVRRGLAQTIARLDAAEQAVLREFALRGQHVLMMPTGDPVVVGLTRKGLIVVVGSEGWVCAAGPVFPHQIAERAAGKLVQSAIGIRDHLDEAQIRELATRRPPWVREVEHHMRLMYD